MAAAPPPRLNTWPLSLSAAAMVLFVVAMLGCSAKKEEADPWASQARDGRGAPGALGEVASSGSSGRYRPISAPEAFQPLVRSVERRTEVIETFRRAEDKAIVPAILELMRFSSLGVIEPLTRKELGVLRFFSRQFLPPEDWDGWMEWYWSSPREELHPGYAFLKQNLFSRFGGELSAMLDPRRSSSVDPTEILPRPFQRFGGVTALDNPPTARVGAPGTEYIQATEPVVGLALGDSHRAYPLRLLYHHEIINDEIDGRWVVVTFSPLSLACFAYEVIAPPDRRPLFGVASLLYRADSLMYDRETFSLWSSRSGRPLRGPRLDDPAGIELRPLAVSQVTWALWQQEWPQTTTLFLETGQSDIYADPNPYLGYHYDPSAGIPLIRRDARLPEKAVVYGLVHKGEAVAYPFDQVAQVGDGVIDEVAGDWIAVIGRPRRQELRAYRLEDRRLLMGANFLLLEEIGPGLLWRRTEPALVAGLDQSLGLQLPRVPGQIVFWYAWQLWHPDTRVYTAPRIAAPSGSTPQNSGANLPLSAEPPAASTAERP